MTMQRWLIAATVTCVAATGCSEAPDGKTAQTARRPQQAGEVTNPLVTASHLAAFDATAVTGDQRAMRTHVEAMQKNMMRDIRLADSSRRIDHKAARPLQGVQSAEWIDNACLALEPLGDTLERATLQQKQQVDRWN
jgi:hypothetical protein